MLRVEQLDAGYGHTTIVRGMSLEIGQGELVSLIGPNGAGKTTFLMALSGVLRPARGRVIFEGRRIDSLEPHSIVALGLSQVPQGAQLFPDMTIIENLEVGSWMGGYSDRSALASGFDEVFRYFPVLDERQNQKAGTLSGGEQQMLAIGRALMSRPRMLMFDEPSAGVAPIMIDRLGEIILELHRSGITVLLVEQNAHLALDLAERCYVMETGCISCHGLAENLKDDERVKRCYLGV